MTWSPALAVFAWADLRIAYPRSLSPEIDSSDPTPSIVAMAKELHEHTRWWQYLFPCLGRPRKEMSENAVNQGLRRLGYNTNEMTAHGFRAMAATLFNEMGEWNPDGIERHLAHVDTNQVRRAYP